MPLEFRVPGPVGLSPTGKPPGPLRYGPGISTKKLGMPAPVKGAETKLARDVTWNLFGKGQPALGDVLQGPRGGGLILNW